MLSPIVSPDEWAKLYNINTKESVCLCCKQTMLLDVPIATKNFRGFKSQEHGCPTEYEQYILFPTNQTGENILNGSTVAHSLYR